LSMGPVLPFMAVSLGQATGSPVVGMLVSEFGYANAFATFSAIGILVAMLSPLYPRYIDYEPEEEAQIEDQTGLQAAYNYQLLDEDGEPLAPVADEADNP
jgi:DHA1 family inner membrane transport protein